MKLFYIVGFGRSGMDFLQSLFDRHPEISQFPGYFSFHKFLLLIKNKKKPKDIAKTFINKYKKFFDSRINTIERHNALGVKKNDFFVINKNEFTKNFVRLSGKNDLDKKSILINLHLSYSLACGQKAHLIKAIIINVHQIYHFKELDSFDHEVIFMIRHPISSLSSGIKHWLKFDKNNVTTWFFYFQIERIFLALKKCIQAKKIVHVIKLSDLHKKNKIIMKDLTKIMNIKFKQSLTKSTYNGKLWWGDKLSDKDLSGVNKKFTENYDDNFFFNKDIQCIEYYLRPFMKKYRFDSFSNNLKKNKLIKFLPLRSEIIIWKNMLLDLKIWQIIMIPYYWTQRIKLMNKNIFKDLNFPNQIGKGIKKL